MKLTAQQHEELERRVAQLLEGTLEPQEFKELERLIADSEEARWYYITRVDMVGSIGWLLHDEVDPKEISILKVSQVAPNILDLLDELPAPSPATTPRGAKLTPAPRRRRNTGVFGRVSGAMQTTARHMLTVGLTAAVVLIGVGMVLGLMQGEDNVAQQEALLPSSDGAGKLRAATLVATQECQWLGDHPPLETGELLQTGEQLSLERGVAEFLFEGGARVILQGPCTFRFDSPSQGTLLLGSLTAQVAEEAVGFTIESGRMKIIDLGTEFGMVISPSGATQTEVFAGEISVRVRSAAAEGWGDSQLLASSEVLSIDSMGSVSREPVIDVKYVRQMPGTVARIAVRNPSFEQPVLPYGEELDSEGIRKNHGEPVAWQITKRAQSSSRNGCLRPLEREFIGSLPHGRQIGYTNKGETLSQVLKEVCAANASYRLSVWVGIRREEMLPEEAAVSLTPAAVIELLAGETVVGRSPGDAIQALKPGEWQRVDVECTTPANGPHVGLPLAIRLSADATSQSQIAYDAVELVMVGGESETTDQE